MNEILCAVIEDSPEFCKEIVRRIPEGICTRDYCCAEDFLASGYCPDLLISDIELPGISGLKLVHEYKSRYTYALFITAHDQYVWDAFGPGVLGFVCKTNLDDLKSEVVKAGNLLCHEDGLSLNRLARTPQIPFSRIERIAWQYNTAVIFLENGQSADTNYLSLKEACSALPKSFVQINRSEWINAALIRQILPSRKSVELLSGQECSISRRNWKSFFESYMNWRLGL